MFLKGASQTINFELSSHAKLDCEGLEDSAGVFVTPSCAPSAHHGSPSPLGAVGSTNLLYRRGELPESGTWPFVRRNMSSTGTCPNQDSERE